MSYTSGTLPTMSAVSAASCSSYVAPPPPPPEPRGCSASAVASRLFVSLMAVTTSAFSFRPNTSGPSVNGSDRMYSTYDASVPSAGMKYVPLGDSLCRSVRVTLRL